MSKRHVRKKAARVAAGGRPRWRVEGRALQREVAKLKAERERDADNAHAALMAKDEVIAKLRADLDAVASPAAPQAEATPNQEAVA